MKLKSDDGFEVGLIVGTSIFEGCNQMLSYVCGARVEFMEWLQLRGQHHLKHQQQ